VSPRTWSLLAALSGLLAALWLAAPGWTRAPAPPPRKKDTAPITNSVGMKLVLVPAGKFTMGSPKRERERYDEDQHEVEITKAFYLGACEVTQRQFKKVMGYNPSHFSHDGTGQPGRRYLEVRKPAGGKGKLPAGAVTDDYPVENVSHDEAVAFCKKLSALPAEKKAGRAYRLPTEAEWEYACRGATSSEEPFHFARPTGKLSSEQANFDGHWPYGGAARGEYLGRPCKVGSYKPNKLGLYDMHGNVYEWCSDWSGKDYYSRSPRKDPQGPAKGSDRIIRGGGYDCSGSMCRAAARLAYVPHGAVTSVGIRVVMVRAGK
jgi:formylglycine-generating enzyme required for sulfatase activity